MQVRRRNASHRSELRGQYSKAYPNENGDKVSKLETLNALQSEKGLLLDSIKAELEDKIHRLEEDKQNVDLSSGLWERSGKSRKRKADPMDPDRRKKPVTVTGPYIVYMLTEDDILEDWTAIKKSLTQRKKTTVWRISPQSCSPRG